MEQGLPTISSGWFWTEKAELTNPSQSTRAGEPVWDRYQHHIPQRWIDDGLVIWALLEDGQVVWDIQENK